MNRCWSSPSRLTVGTLLSGEFDGLQSGEIGLLCLSDLPGLLSLDIGGFAFLPQRLDGTPPRELRPMVDGLKKKLGSGVCAIVTVNDGKAALVVGVSDDLTARISAVNLVRAGAAILGGSGGGGRADMAQAGGPDGEKADAALKAIETALRSLA